MKVPPIPRSFEPAGFTLVEVMITLGVLALVAALASPSLMAMVPAMQLKSAARDLYSAIQEAKMLAIKENKTIRIRIDTVNGNYYIDADDNGAFTPGEKRVVLEDYDNDDDALSNAEKGVEFFAPPETNKNWSNADMAQAPVLTFNSRGTALAGSLYLVNGTVNRNYSDLKTDGEAINAYAVAVRSTGSIRTYKYTGTLATKQAGWDN